MADRRAERIAHNESRFREINERLRNDLSSVTEDPTELVPFVCECGHTECREAIELSLVEYERVRADPHLFAVVQGHSIADVEDVLARTDRYHVVRKHAETQPITESTDPRT